jgi:1,4-dihydroxy-2-naphthoate octaprenyltransferase
VADVWSKAQVRRSTRRAAGYALVPVVAGSVVAYFLADLVVALLMLVTLLFCTFAGIAVSLKITDWYSDLMNKPWGRRE